MTFVLSLKLQAWHTGSASVQVYDLIARDTVEKEILKLQSRKTELMEAAADCILNGILDMPIEELLALFD